MYERVLPYGKTVRMGWARPDISLNLMSSRIRSIPDYYASGFLVEVMGLGRDGVLKLKEDKWDALRWWNTSGNPVSLFVWNSSTSEYALIEWGVLVRLVAMGRAAGVLAFEVDGNRYYPIRWEWVIARCGATHYPPAGEGDATVQ